MIYFDIIWKASREDADEVHTILTSARDGNGSSELEEEPGNDLHML
jgi:hypothetical protein